MVGRELTISHAIGPDGRFRLTCASGSVVIDGIDGAEVRVLARYRAPGGADPTGDPAQDGVVEVVRDEGELRVAVRDPGGSGILAGLTRLAGQYRPAVDFQVRLPRAAALRLDGVACDAKLRDLRGEQDLHTVSGDLELRGAGGRIRVTTVSGDVAVGGDVLSLAATTTSGDLAVEAELVEQLAIKSVSGDVSVRAALGRAAGHTFESVSGDLQLTTPNGLAIEVSGVSGAVRSDLPMRREQQSGRRTTVIGDGSVGLRVRTVSGDVIVSGPGRSPTSPRPPSLPRRPPVPDPPDLPPVPPVPGLPHVPVVAPPAVITLPAPATAATAAADQLSILRLLESGHIDVEEAARRLEALT